MHLCTFGILTLLIGFSCGKVSFKDTRYSGSDINVSWKDYKEIFEKNYSEIEDELRKSMFLSTVKYVNEQNKENQTYKLGVGIFADATEEEKDMLLGGVSYPQLNELKEINYSKKYVPSIINVPAALDWRNVSGHSYVTPIKAQGKCGSCWIFAGVGVLESYNAIYNGKLVEFSEQHILDCNNYGSGCLGGHPALPIIYHNQNDGICTSKDYPYVGKEGECNHFCKHTDVGSVDTVGIDFYNETETKMAVAEFGPLGIIFLVYPSFINDPSGIYRCKEGEPRKSLHAMLLVGYGSENGDDYWVLKNSYGQKWNGDGYVKFARNDPNNFCKFMMVVGAI